MRRFLAAVALVSGLGGAAEAADLPVQAPVLKSPAAAPAASWSGFYFGGHLGGAWSDTDWSGINFAPGFVFPFETSGHAGGVQVGFNHQVGQWVFGVEGSWTWTDLYDVFVLSPSNSYATDIDHLVTVVGRIGYTWDRWLAYVSGGYAAAQVKGAALGSGLPGSFTFEDTHDGWTVGAGFEYLLPNNFVFGADYKYIDLSGSKNVTTTIGVPVSFSNIDTTIQVLTARLSYKFSWAP